MKTILFASAVGVTLVAAAPSSPAPLFWGDHGHRMVGRLAAEALPADMPAFFRQSTSRLEYLNPEPDRWRDEQEQLLEPALNLAYAYDHYVDLEWVPEGALRARNRFAYLDSVRTAGRRTPIVGLLPFSLIEMTQRLRVDFREWRKATDPQTKAWIEQRIIDDAGVLGHFVADASNPHHTTEHHDGWVGDNPKGYTRGPFFHGRFESQYVGAQLKIDDVRPLLRPDARIHSDVRASVIAYLRESHALVPRLYDLDKLQPFGPDNTNPEHRRFTAERLAAGATMLRDLWWTSWVTSQ
jgi:hypothetical protein